MATIYRVETIAGEGPYCVARRLEIDLYDTHGRHPTPWNDHDDKRIELEERLQSDNHDDQLFGFNSVEDLSRWFCAAARYALGQLGYRCSVYEADDVLELNHQVIFDRTRAHKVDVWTLDAIPLS